MASSGAAQSVSTYRLCDLISTAHSHFGFCGPRSAVAMSSHDESVKTLRTGCRDRLPRWGLAKLPVRSGLCHSLRNIAP